MLKSKMLFSVAGVVLSLSMLAIPASAHGGGHHGGTRAASTSSTVYCTVCQADHARGECPNYCGDCDYSHTGDRGSYVGSYGCGRHSGGHH